MQTLTANEAKTQFGNLLLMAQREPVQINRNGKPVAVVISAQEYAEIDSLKRQLLKAKLERAKQDIDHGRLTDGDDYFRQLMDE
ncbi:type II toxin-antitoxin system Phd/YefM family antitoxin [Cronobacter dublinensis]|uniref:type II toxin-antitoxin system Phd/YefM family antitoxin n=1 Tax=Cronobacter dublinensis TaxID=413497 RepID=UPI000CFDDF55|nr:type II toxin-antitoxin system prevent-host-death family antitoxin [Cronobacter dublinensis]EGT5713050.1 type II toxin-antitoxin system Phd/YefM family antitoxin [Cronobacter dublinensis subsp. dublinensis]EGT5738364.1 type II toxin-antitoxin system Phd/YefM family antitoxin [Cronobacter dublinensis subsp. dublinensis]EKY3222414.1 type II toxin-antitoxin system Phd/YefM family antitoxin [Cronobacter dublinensis]ELQ6169409.1 type II toxin-antitoxin system Phd/YefM family antitoxin [Cronobacte